MIMNARDTAKSVHKLFSLPEVAIELSQAIDSRQSNSGTLASIINKDPALAATLLKLVNSAYFGFGKPIDSITHAVTLLGRSELKMLVFSISIVTRFHGIPSDLVDMDVFWFHSITRGIMSQELARQLKFAEPDRLYLSGMLSTLGKLIIYHQYPGQSTEILTLDNQADDFIREQELSHFGFDYLDVGVELFKLWRLPETLWQIVDDLGKPLLSKDQQPGSLIVHVASQITQTLEPCHKRLAEYKEQDLKLDIKVLEHLGLTPNMLNHCMEHGLAEAFDVAGIICPEAFVIY